MCDFSVRASGMGAIRCESLIFIALSFNVLVGCRTVNQDEYGQEVWSCLALCHWRGVWI